MPGVRSRHGTDNPYAARWRCGATALLMAYASIVGPAVNAADFSVADSALPKHVVFVAYGDMRFTDGQETEATKPAARRALVAKIARENPVALFVSGDVPYHGIDADYNAFREETAAWRRQRLRLYPAIGNHELALCQVPICLERWWNAFPGLRERRWYSVALGARVYAIVLDSTSSLLPGSDQQEWFEAEMAALNPDVRVVLVVIHHPPVADLQTAKLVDHNVRPNEAELADALSRLAANSPARFVVSAGHIHNYERLEKAGVTYLVSGGGGAHPADIDRTDDDLYRGSLFPNYHYVRFELCKQRLVAEMIRLEDSDAARPSHWKVRDRFEVGLRP